MLTPLSSLYHRGSHFPLSVSPLLPATAATAAAPSRGRSVLSGGPYDPDPDPLLGLLAPTAPPPALAGVVFVFGGTLAGGARGGGAGPMGRGAS